MTSDHRRAGVVGTVARAITSALIVAWLVMFAGGCSDRYERSDLTLDGPEAQQVRGDLEALRAGGDVKGFLGLHTPDDLTADQRGMLEAVVGRLARADGVELVRIDRFGADVVRIELRVAEGPAVRTANVLLVRRGERLLWAGPT
jgi:hypothetical protein